MFNPERERLLDRVSIARGALMKAQLELDKFDLLAENNVFDSLDEAIEFLESKLLDEAYEACEGSYNRGLDSYSQDFIVNGVVYTATLDVEYNRHDKKYYYVEDSTFTYKEKI